MRRRTTGIPPWTLAVTAMLLIQLSNALSVWVIDRIGPAGTSWLRMCLGTLLLWIVARPPIRSIRRRDVPLLLALGTATGVMTTAFLAAIERIPLGTAVAIEFLGPLTVAALGSRRRGSLTWPALALVGVVLLTEPWHGGIDLAGIEFALLAGAGWGVYIVLTQRAGDRFSGVTTLSLTIPVAAVVTSVLGLPQVLGGDFDWTVLLVAAGIALITPVISFGLELIALRRMNHTAFGTLMALEPSFGVLIGLVLLHQVPTAVQVLGIALVVLAGAAAQRDGLRDEMRDGPRDRPPPPHGT